MNSITIANFTVRFIDSKMFIYFQESDCESKKIISESYFADIPLPTLDGQSDFICHSSYIGYNNDNHTVISGRTSETKKDTDIQLFYFYLRNQKIRILMPFLEYEEIISSSRNKGLLSIDKSSRWIIEGKVANGPSSTSLLLTY